jgi:hypothetical protein
MLLGAVIGQPASVAALATLLALLALVGLAIAKLSWVRASSVTTRRFGILGLLAALTLLFGNAIANGTRTGSYRQYLLYYGKLFGLACLGLAVLFGLGRLANSPLQTAVDTGRITSGSAKLLGAALIVLILGSALALVAVMAGPHP